jgi:purine-binding chemotaxis protein CheW
MSAMENIEAAARAGGVPVSAVSDLAVGKEYLSFHLGAEEYGIDILKVQEIRGYETPTRIVNAPAFIKGVVNLRGVIVPIIDLRIKFDLADVKYDDFSVVIVLNLAKRVVGAVVDSVSDVLNLKGDQVKPAPKFNGAVNADFITGIGSIRQGGKDRMLILMDIEQLIASADMGLVETRVAEPSG